MSNQIKDRIRKLLNLAEDNDQEHEIDAALRFARRLMLKHNISEEDVAEAGTTTDPHEIAADTEYARSDVFTSGAKLSWWESTLGAAVDALVGTVKHYIGGRAMRRTSAGTIRFKNGKPQYATKIVFYGPSTDVAEAQVLFDEWSQLIATMSRMKYGGCFRGEGRSYAEGFAMELYRKAYDAVRLERAAVTSGESVELADVSAGEKSDKCTALAVQNAHALMAAKKARAGTWLEEECGIKLRARGGGGGGGEHHSDAYGAGRADGARANFSRGSTKRLS